MNQGEVMVKYGVIGDDYIFAKGTLATAGSQFIKS